MLTSAQNALIKTAVLADNVLKTYPATSDGSYAIAAALNLPDASNTSVWWSATPVDNIFNSLTWANYTPNDAADGTAIYTNRTLLAQTKQMNLQNMLVGRDTINMTNALTRQGLKDAVHNIPTGTGGALVDVGGTNGATALAACIRPTTATRIEKILSTGPSTTSTTTADVLGFEGAISYQQIGTAMGWSF